MSCRGLVVFIIALILLRTSGRRSFGMRTPLDNIIVILLGAVLSRAVVGVSPFWPVICACLFIVLFHRGMAWAMIKSKRLRLFVQGDKIMLFEAGKVRHEDMRKALVCREDLEQAVRKKSAMEYMDKIDRCTWSTPVRYPLLKNDLFKFNHAFMTYLSVFILVLASVGVEAQRHAAPLPAANHRFIVVAHRGDHEHVPENTVASVKEAIKAGVDYVEIDLRTSKDGYLVLMHDASVNRMTNGKGNVKDLTLDSIRALQIKNGDKIYRIPEFKDVLKACNGRINIYLDFKDADVAETYRQIKRAGMEKHVVVYINKEPQYGTWRKTAPHMPLMTSLPDTIKTAEGLARFLKTTPVEVFDNLYDHKMIAAAKKKHVAVWLDAEEENENAVGWDKVLDKKVAGMQTDHPEELIRYLEQKRVR